MSAKMFLLLVLDTTGMAIKQLACSHHAKRERDDNQWWDDEDS